MSPVLTSSEIRSRFLAFFADQKRGKHEIIPSASLVTPDEKGITNPTLFNTAGMQPLIPYLLGKPYVMPDGREVKRLVDAQKVLRTVDIDDIGDKTHATFFEMLGNWSLGDYFKKEAIEWSYEFLTSTSDVPGERGLGLDPRRLYVTVFKGDANVPKDEEAAEIWRGIFKKNGIDAGGDTTQGKSGRIFYLPAKNNWWEAGDNGPCGPDTEMFYDISNTFSGRPVTHDEYVAADEARHVIEIWNDVFMQYEKKDGKIIGPLPKPSVDTGAGLERLTMTLQGVDNVYDTDLLKPIMDKIKESSTNWNLKSARIVADHIRASVFLISDGVVPAPNGRGYVLRKLLRRAIYYADTLKLAFPLFNLTDLVADKYKNIYPNLDVRLVKSQIDAEDQKFRATLKNGLREFEKIVSKTESSGNSGSSQISGIEAFNLHQNYGFPIELILELAKEKGVQVASAPFEEEMKKHQSLSRAGAEQKFKGGLADANDPTVVRYHTATHLLHQALHDVLGDGVEQKGSNITAERLRFDFSFPRKMTDDEKKRVEDIVNKKIAAAIPVGHVVMPRAEAEKTGARHSFNEKYGEEISIYFVGVTLTDAYSKEFCGGPHVKNTSELAGPDGSARFKILKEEAVSQGVRRIKAVLV